MYRCYYCGVINNDKDNFIHGDECLIKNNDTHVKFGVGVGYVDLEMLPIVEQLHKVGFRIFSARDIERFSRIDEEHNETDEHDTYLACISFRDIYRKEIFMDLLSNGWEYFTTYSRDYYDDCEYCVLGFTVMVDWDYEIEDSVKREIKKRMNDLYIWAVELETRGKAAMYKRDRWI